MAAWQFLCNIIPSRENIDNLSRNEMISWLGISPPIIDIDFLDCKKSWSTDIVQYGNIDETCIEFFYDKDKLEEINCRLDLRTLTKHIFIQIVEYVQSIGAMFLVGDKVYPPKFEVMVEVIQHSEANRFCNNPPEYFLSLDGIEEM